MSGWEYLIVGLIALVGGFAFYIIMLIVVCGLIGAGMNFADKSEEEKQKEKDSH